MGQPKIDHTQASEKVFVIAGWHVDPAALRVSKQNKIHKIEPKVMAVLEYLAARPGVVVSREELEEAIWVGMVVGYDAISNAIIKLRKAFGDKAKNAEIIETIPKTGYRLIAPVEPAIHIASQSPASDVLVEPTESPQAVKVEVESNMPSQGSAWKLIVMIAIPLLILMAAGLAWFNPPEPEIEVASIERMAFPLPDKPSIAVLPFNNMSDDPQQEYFVDGMTEDLITDISKIPGLFVIARNSVFTYKGRNVKVREVAEDLGVRYVLEGSVRRVGDQVRINAQLIDALSGGHVWAERYDGVAVDVFALQDEVTRGIVEQLAINLSVEDNVAVSQGKPVSPEAYDLFLKGWGYYRSGNAIDYKSAIGIFKQVIEMSPDFNRAHAALAAVYWNILAKGWWQESLGIHYYQAFELARKALRHSQENPTALTHQIASEWIVHYTKTRKSPRRALDQAELALQLDPNHPAGHLALANALLFDDRPQEARRSIRFAMRLDPHYPAAYLVRLAQVQFQLADYQAAVELLEQALDQNLDDSWTNLYLASAYGQLDLREKAREALARANSQRATDGWGPVTIVSMAHPDFRWQGSKDALKAGLRAAGTPVGGEWFQLIKYHSGTEQKSPLVKGATAVNAKEAKVLHERGAIFVDTRSTWLAGHIPGAHFLEWGKTEGWLFNEVALSRLGSKDAEFVIYAFDENSKFTFMAAALAVSRGFTNIYFFDGGLDAWKAAGYPVAVPE